MVGSEPDQVEPDEPPDRLEQADLELHAEPVAPVPLADFQRPRGTGGAHDDAPRARSVWSVKANRMSARSLGLRGPITYVSMVPSHRGNADDVLALARRYIL